MLGQRPLRKRTMSMLGKEKFITADKGKKKAVILDIKFYEEILGDLEDLRLLAKRKDEATSSFKKWRRG